MKIDKNGDLIHEDYESSFQYKNRLFIIDKLDNGYLITESQFILNASAPTLKEAKIRVKNSWDQYIIKKQNS